MSIGIADVLRPHVPAAALAYCAGLQRQHGFRFRLNRPRTSKWGDYRYRKTAQQVSHCITVNQNLNPYAFLITYLHEVAHLVAFRQHGFRIRPHGRAWQQAFRQLLEPVLTESVLPPDLLVCLRRYAQHPRASTGADALLTLALQTYDIDNQLMPLTELPPGATFCFRQRTYVKKYLRRTRVLCQEVVTQKEYLILKTVRVERID